MDQDVIVTLIEFLLEDQTYFPARRSNLLCFAMFCLLEVAVQTRETPLGPDDQKNERKRMGIRAYGQLSYGLMVGHNTTL